MTKHILVISAVALGCILLGCSVCLVIALSLGGA